MTAEVPPAIALVKYLTAALYASGGGHRVVAARATGEQGTFAGGLNFVAVVLDVSIAGAEPIHGLSDISPGYPALDGLFAVVVDYDGAGADIILGHIWGRGLERSVWRLRLSWLCVRGAHSAADREQGDNGTKGLHVGCHLCSIVARVRANCKARLNLGRAQIVSIVETFGSAVGRLRVIDTWVGRGIIRLGWARPMVGEPAVAFHCGNHHCFQDGCRRGREARLFLLRGT